MQPLRLEATEFVGVFSTVSQRNLMFLSCSMVSSILTWALSHVGVLHIVVSLMHTDIEVCTWEEFQDYTV